jgi:hypothetical protein
VLELSKLLMYKVHYDHFKRVYGDAAQLLYTDTDSLIYHIQTENLWRDCHTYRTDLFDMSFLPATNEFYDGQLKDVPGPMKIETKDYLVKEMVFLAPKVYSYKYEHTMGSIREQGEGRRAKGIQRCVVANHFNHDNYLTQLYDPHNISVTVRRIGSINHLVYSFRTQKRGLTAIDDKRYLLEDGINSVPYGYRNPDGTEVTSAHQHLCTAPETVPELQRDHHSLQLQTRSDAMQRAHQLIEQGDLARTLYFAYLIRVPESLRVLQFDLDTYKRENLFRYALQIAEGANQNTICNRMGHEIRQKICATQRRLWLKDQDVLNFILVIVKFIFHIIIYFISSSYN